MWKIIGTVSLTFTGSAKFPFIFVENKIQFIYHFFAGNYGSMDLYEFYQTTLKIWKTLTKFPHFSFSTYVLDAPNTFFFLENYWIFSQISFRLIMENNFIQMAALASHVVVYTIAPIFKHIIDSVHLYFTNGFTNIVL